MKPDPNKQIKLTLNQALACGAITYESWVSRHVRAHVLMEAGEAAQKRVEKETHRR